MAKYFKIRKTASPCEVCRTVASKMVAFPRVIQIYANLQASQPHIFRILQDFATKLYYKTVLHKLYRLGFSKSFLKWTVSYLTSRKQFVKIDDRVSESLQLTLGAPQGSIMGPLLFNLYVTDLNSELDATCHQYADDTTLYRHSKPSELNESVSALQSTLRKLEDWSERSNLVINPEKN